MMSIIFSIYTIIFSIYAIILLYDNEFLIHTGQNSFLYFKITRN